MFNLLLKYSAMDGKYSWNKISDQIIAIRTIMNDIIVLYLNCILFSLIRDEYIFFTFYEFA